MAQNKFKDPIVSAGPTLTGTGNGTLAVDKLTHFTVAQDYSLTCIAKSPDTLFSVIGSLDGPAGIAKVGTQFFDDDLKIFLTIQQGFTPFEVGDKFELTVENGTDLNQDNIDDYDELPQKNFGEGVKGVLSGDNNVRYSDDDVFATLLLQNLKFTSQIAGSAGNDTQVEYLDYIPAVASSLALQDLLFECNVPGMAGDVISIEYVQYTPATKGQLIYQDLTFRAIALGVSGNSITMRYTTGGTAGSEVVTVVSNAISVQIQSGTSTATQIKAAIDGYGPAAALIAVTISGTGSNAQSGAFGPTNLSGGAPAIGDAGHEVVTVVSNAISIQLEGGVSTAMQVKAAIDASIPATALISVTIAGTGSNAQTAPVSQTFLSDGADAIGLEAPYVAVTGSLIQVYFNSGSFNPVDIKTAIDDYAPAAALIGVETIGPVSDRQFSPISATNLEDGNSKFYSLNKHELTEPGDFSEGNASARMHDATILGHASIAKNAEISGKVTLKDSDSNVIPDLQKYVNWLMQDQKVTLRTADHTKVIWSKPEMSFTADIVIDFNDTDHYNSISSSYSPLSMDDGQSLYVILDRDHDRYIEPIVGNSVPEMINAFRIASRFGDNIILWDNTLIRDGGAARIGEGGGEGGGGTLRVDLYNPVSTTLPTGTSATIDGVALQNDMLVLFSNLASNNNRIYRAAGVGTSISWTVQTVWTGGLTPNLSEDVMISQGTSFGLQRGIFDGTTFKFNDTVRYFNGVDYWEVSSLKTITISASTTAEIFSLNSSGSENIMMDYSILRGDYKETGTLYLTCRGTEVKLASSGAYLGAVGIDFSATISTGTLHVSYTSDSTAGASLLKYYIRRWSDGAGGPGGIPSYATSDSSSTVAAGSGNEIQFNDGGFLGADSTFTYDRTTKVMNMNGLEMFALQGPVTLVNNTSTFTDILSYNMFDYPFVFIEYSLNRGVVFELGKFMITNNTVIAEYSHEFVSVVGSTAITFRAIVSGSNVKLQYTSADTGEDAVFKYTMRRWG